MNVVVDWQNFVKNISFSVLSGSIPCAYPTEPDEIAHRVLKRVFCLRQEYPEANIIFAADKKPYWRHKYLLDWYSSRGIEPVIYKGNRSSQNWPFHTSIESMGELHRMLLTASAQAIGGTIIQEDGLEADDIWGVICESSTAKVVGYTADSDWRQKITDRVRVYDFTKDVLHTEPIDIRVKWIGGDPGDGIKGCTKLKKDGTPAKNGWGQDGAKKLLASNPDDWFAKLNKDELDRNYHVTTLPCPEWNVPEVAEYLAEIAETFEPNEKVWDRYGITCNVRKLLSDKANRDSFVKRLRMHIIDQSKLKAQGES